MTDIRQRLRMLADNTQRSEIVEDAIRLIDRLEGKVNMDLPIKVLSRDEVLMGAVKLKWTRVQVENEIEKFSKCHSGNETALYIGWREILRRMDEFKAPKKKSWDLGCVGGQSSDVEPQRKKPEPNKQVPEETISSPSHQQWLRERKKQDSLNPRPIEEPEPKWEPGTLLRGGSEIYRLDVFSKLGDDEQSEIWDFTDMHTGESLTGGDFPYLFCEIYRLPHEFKVGDWAQWIDHTPGPFQVMNVQAVDGRETLYGFGAFLPAEECRHVPPPKEEKPAQKRQECVISAGVRATAIKPPFASAAEVWEEMAMTPYQVEIENEPTYGPRKEYKWVAARRVRPDGTPDPIFRGLFKLDSFGVVPEEIESHRAGKTSERFSGPQWYRAKRSAKHPEEKFTHYEAAQCLCDLKDAWLEKEGKG